MAITTVIVVIIVLGIVLVLLNANPANPLVNLVLDVGRWLTTRSGTCSGWTPSSRACW